MDYKAILINLYYLVIYADGKVNDKEVVLGKQMARTEGMDEGAFSKTLGDLKSKDPNSLYTESIAALKKLDSKTQVRCIAWLCVIANGDGFMDKEEWTFIYKIYHTDLGLQLNEVMETQKELNQIIYGKAFQSIGVRVN